MRIRATCLAALMVVLPGLGVAGAQAPNDYSARWLLQATGDSRAWSFEADEAILAMLQDPGFGDLQVFNAAGDPVPTARMASAPAPAAPRWLQARFASGGPADGPAGDAGVMSYAYRLPASLAIDAVRITVGTTSPSANVALQYQQGEQWITAARLPVAGRSAAVAAPAGADAGAGAGVEGAAEAGTEAGRVAVDSAPANETRFAQPISAHEWRVRSGIALAPAPTLQLAWRPVRFVFLANGAGPYTLAVGSPTLRRGTTIDPQLLRLRDGAGASAPPLVALGPRTAAPFVAAVAAAPVANAWPRWVGGGLALGLAGGLAFVLARRRRALRYAV